jgi:hypothetical protein
MSMRGPTTPKNRFNAAFLSDVDDYILEANKRSNGAAGACPIHYPSTPGGRDQRAAPVNAAKVKSSINMILNKIQNVGNCNPVGVAGLLGFGHARERSRVLIAHGESYYVMRTASAPTLATRSYK